MAIRELTPNELGFVSGGSIDPGDDAPPWTLDEEANNPVSTIAGDLSGMDGYLGQVTFDGVTYSYVAGEGNASGNVADIGNTATPSGNEPQSDVCAHIASGARFLAAASGQGLVLTGLTGGGAAFFIALGSASALTAFAFTVVDEMDACRPNFGL